MKKRLLSLLLALTLCLALLPGMAAAEDQGPIELTQDNYKDYFTTGWRGYAFLNAGSYILNQDITFDPDSDPEGASLLRIGFEDEPRKVTLDLNGHVLKQTRSDWPVIQVYPGSTLTIVDSSPNVPHRFSVDDTGRWQLNDGGNEVVYGGIITSTASGTAIRIQRDYNNIEYHTVCTMDGGNIVGGSYSNSGGVHVDQYTEFIMNGGSIRGCTVTDTGHGYGSGVYVMGTFTMNGGTISDCMAGAGGDAVYVDSKASFSMSANATIDGTVYGAHTVTFDSNGGSAVPSLWCANLPVIKPDDPTKDGYTFAGWYTDQECTTAYDFDTMNVTTDITLYAKWTPVPAAPVTPAEEPTTPWWTVLPALDQTADFSFDDVNKDDWFYNDVYSAYEAGFMTGTSANAFSPYSSATRGMIVTVLARMSGVSTAGTPWYAAGQRWAMTNGISDGTNMTGSITREQLVAMLYRYAQLCGADVSVGADTNILSYDDAGAVSEYAVPAMQWACGAGLVQGAGGKLSPKALANRAQVAALLMRFCTLVR